MVYDTIMMVAVLTLPLVVGAFMLWFMATGKGNPAPTQSEIEQLRRKRQANAADNNN